MPHDPDDTPNDNKDAPPTGTPTNTLNESAASRKFHANRSPVPDDPAAILADCWTTLRRGAADRRHPFHLPTLATVGPAGQPEARTVVLRVCDDERRTLSFHTDRRSPKAIHLTERPACAWLFYNPGDRVQLRVAATATVHTDDAHADAAWARTHLMSRRCYLAPHPPSEPAPAPSPNLPDWAANDALTADNTAHARDHFAFVQTTVTEIDWLILHHAGHRRARFRFGAGGRVETTWLQP